MKSRGVFEKIVDDDGSTELVDCEYEGAYQSFREIGTHHLEDSYTEDLRGGLRAGFKGDKFVLVNATSDQLGVSVSSLVNFSQEINMPEYSVHAIDEPSASRFTRVTVDTGNTMIFEKGGLSTLLPGDDGVSPDYVKCVTGSDLVGCDGGASDRPDFFTVRTPESTYYSSYESPFIHDTSVKAVAQFNLDKVRRGKAWDEITEASPEAPVLTALQEAAGPMKGPVHRADLIMAAVASSLGERMSVRKGRKTVFSVFIGMLLVATVMSQFSMCSEDIECPASQGCYQFQCRDDVWLNEPCNSPGDCLSPLYCQRNSPVSVVDVNEGTCQYQGSSMSMTAQVSPTRTKSGTVTPTQSRTPSRTLLAMGPSATGTGSKTATMTMRGTPSMTAIPTVAAPSPTASMTNLASTTGTPSIVPGPSGSGTPTGVPSSTSSVTVLPSNSGTPAVTPAHTSQQTGTPTGSPPTGTPTGSILPSSSASASHAVQVNTTANPTWLIPAGSVSATGSKLPTTGPSPSIWIEPTGKLPGGHFNHPRKVSSDAARNTGLLVFFFAYTAEAARCVGTRLAKTMSEFQFNGTDFTSALNYTYSSEVKVGIEDPVLMPRFCDDNYLRPEELVLSEHLSRSLKSLVVSSSPVFVYLDLNVLTFRFIDAQPRIIEVNAQGLTWTGTTAAPLYYVTLPEEVMQVSGGIVARTYTGMADLESSNAFTIVGSKPCVIKDCWFCNLLNWDCTPKLMRALVLVVIILVCVVILYICFQCSATIIMFFSLGWSCCSLVSRALWNFCSNKAGLMALWVRTSAARDIGRTVVLMSFILGASACDSSLVLNVPTSSCVVSQAETSCTFNVDTIMSFRGPGHKACLNLYGPNGPIGVLSVEFSSNQVRCSLSNQYYTSSFEIYSLSSFRCDGAGPCSGTCDDLPDRTAGGEFNSTNYIDYPGATRCTRRCSGFACGCLLPAAGCVYSTYSIRPIGEMSRVSEIATCERQPSFSYVLTDSVGSVVSTGTIDIESSFGEDDYLSGEVISEGDSNMPQNFPTHVMQNKEVVRLLDASRKSRPEAGEIGDIQADNSTALRNGIFAYDPSILVRIDEKAKHDKYVSQQPGYSKSEQAKVLPTVLLGAVWSSNADKTHWATEIRSYDNRRSESLLGIKIKDNVTLTSLVNMVCPIVEFVSLEGCRDCDYGAVAKFKARSSCLEGSVVVTGEGVTETIWVLGRSEQEYSVVVQTDKESYKEDLDVSGVKVGVRGELSEGLLVGQTELLYNGTESKKAHESFRVGEWSWWEYSIFGVVCLVVILLLGWLAITLVGPAVALGFSKILRKKVELPKKVEKTEPPRRRRWDSMKREFI